MGKGSESGSSTKDFHGSIAGVLCAGPVDELVGIILDGKLVWPAQWEWRPARKYVVGSMRKHIGKAWRCILAHTSNAAKAPPNATYWVEASPVLRSASPNPYPLTIENYGQCFFYWGTSDQVLDTVSDVLASNGRHPPYRRQALLSLKNFLFGRERTSAPNIEVVVRRYPNRQTVVTGDSALLDDGQANPVAAEIELFTDPVFGLGLPNTAYHAASAQSVADALAAEPDRTYLSPYLDKAMTARAFTALLLSHYDGWKRHNSAGEIESGKFPHNEAPPTFTAANTIDFHDLVDRPEIDVEGWSETYNETQVKFRDRARAYKDNVATDRNLYNRSVTNEPRTQKLDRPWITREQQAKDYAAEHGKTISEPKIKGSLIVRAEKATSIEAGDLFLFTHDTLSLICRCVEKTLAAPPAGRVTIQFESDHAASQFAVGGATTDDDDSEVDVSGAEVVSLQQFAQVPPELSGGADFHLALLAARTDPMTIGVRPWLQKEDPALFQQLGEQRNWAVYGTLQQNYADTVPVTGDDDNGETLRLTLHASTVAADLEKISETQGEDQINDNTILVFIFSAADPKDFEILTLRTIRLDTQYKLKVRRNRYNTERRAFVTGDRAFIIHRAALGIYTHVSFEDLAETGDDAIFRLQAFTIGEEADLTDEDLCPDITYLFNDPYAPTNEWVSYKKNGSTISDFSPDFLPSDEWEFSWTLSDANGDLTQGQLVARDGTQEIQIWNGLISGAEVTTTKTFTLPTTGDWEIYAIAKDATGRTVEFPQTPIGGGSPITISIVGPTPAVPVASPDPGTYAAGALNITLGCATGGATIEYQVVPLGDPVGGSWTTYTVPFSIAVPERVWARSLLNGVYSADTSFDYAV